MSRLILSLLLGLSTPATAQTVHYVGTAYQPDSRQMVYTESYTERYSTTGKLESASVLYEETNGKVLAEKELDFSGHPFAPAFEFHNRKTGYRESISWLDDGRIRLTHQEPGAQPQQALVTVAEPVVADAGFNQFMREHLSQLKSGKPVAFHFLNPAKLTWYRFTARVTDIQNQRISVRIAPANMVLNWLVQPIDLIYSEPDGRLLQYSGLTNISLQGSKTISARIEYEYRARLTSALYHFHETLEYWLTPSEV